MPTYSTKNTARLRAILIFSLISVTLPLPARAAEQAPLADEAARIKEIMQQERHFQALALYQSLDRVKRKKLPGPFLLLIASAFEQSGADERSRDVYRLILERRDGFYGEALVALAALGEGRGRSLCPLLSSPPLLKSNEQKRSLISLSAGCPSNPALLENARSLGIQAIAADDQAALLSHFSAVEGDEAVLTFCRPLLKTRPGSYYTLLGNFFWQKSRRKEAAGMFRQGYETTGHLDFLKLLGALYLEEGRRDEALATWQSMLQSNTSNYYKYKTLASTLFDYGFTNEALKVLSQARDSHSLLFPDLKSLILESTGQTRQAFEYMLFAYAQKRITASRLEQYARERYEKPDMLQVMAEAVASIRKSKRYTNLDDQGRDTLNRLTVELSLRQGYYPRAFDAALELSIHKIDRSYSYLSLCDRLVRQAVYPAGRQCLEKFHASARPDDLKSYAVYLEALIEFNTGTAAKALKILEKIKEAGLVETRVRLLTGRIYRRQEKFAEAARYFMAADKDGRNELAEVLLMTGQVKLAAKHLPTLAPPVRYYYLALNDILNDRYKEASERLDMFIRYADSEGRNSKALFLLYLIEELNLPKKTTARKKRFIHLSVQAALGFHRALLDNIEDELKKEGDTFTTGYLHYYRLLILSSFGRREEALAELDRLGEGPKELRAHITWLQTRLKNKGFMNYLKSHRNSPYSFFAREMLNSESDGKQVPSP